VEDKKNPQRVCRTMVYKQLRFLNIKPSDVKKSICVSLACYSKHSFNVDTKALKEYSSVPCTWPTDGSLTMNVLYKMKKTTFSLSPPFIVAPNGWVDVSDFISEKDNVIELGQLSDMSDYIFMLRAHHPTGAQLEQVAHRRQKEQAWEDWLVRMSQPIDVQVPSFC